MDVKSLLTGLTKADFADALGIYLGDTTLALALVRKRFNRVNVVAFGSHALAAPSEAREAEITGLLRQFLEHHRVDSVRVGVVLERKEAFLGQVHLPATAAENLSQVVSYELDRVLPVSADGLFWTQYARAMGTDGERVTAVVVAARKERVEAAYGIVSGAGLTASSVTVQPVAVSDYGYFCLGGEAGVVGVFVPEGDRGYLTLCADGTMVASHRVERGRGDAPVEALRREVDRSAPDLAARELVVVAEAEPGAASFSDIAPEGFLTEGARPTSLEAAAIGAALGLLGEAKHKVNLLPAEMVSAEEGVGLREMGLSAAVVVLSLVLMGTIAVKNLRMSNALTSELSQLEPVVTAVAKEEESNRRLTHKLEVLEEGRARSVLSYVRALTTLIPKSAYLTTFRYRGDRLEVDGIADNSAEMVSILEKSRFFKNVEFTAPTTKYLQDKERFSLRMGLAE